MIQSLLRVAEHLAALSETCGETVVIGSVRGNEVVYIDVVEFEAGDPILGAAGQHASVACQLDRQSGVEPHGQHRHVPPC